ncbi:hypothetical protein FNV43_RR11297 [Rhamnella rubrinervis]|uniref:AB hydrolase-1 domain-containing protein n=1 Tax=Rhamnella rubrinervis TaxID=2594499 RepID=A0A8K0H5Q1_9ROSA|nr:hypothetical protein FNV43_RR11297 [Rhamnella rubrinervis]
MIPSFLSPVNFYSNYLRRCFTTSGLSPQTLDVDDDTTIHFWGPKQAYEITKKPSLVLIHGYGPVAIWQWRKQVQFFAPKFNVYVPDLVFFGGSTTRSSERSEIFQAASLAKLMKKVGVERYSVMGTSYGGFVAYHIARMWPERVEKVVIASSGVNMRSRHSEALLKRANVEKVEDLMLPATASQFRVLMSLAVFKQLNLVPDFLLNDVLNKLYADKRNEKLQLMKGISSLSLGDAISISPLQQEVLILWGEHDQIFPLELATELNELLGDKARLEVMKNTSHVPQIENPPLFNDIVNKFLCESS